MRRTVVSIPRAEPGTHTSGLKTLMPYTVSSRRKGVEIVRGICDQPYGCRDFEVADCNGYRLCFGQAIERP
jgi:hypothetical protein